jgi:hypothetical protein
MSIDAFLAGGMDAIDAAFGTTPMTVGEITIPVVANGLRKSYDGALGGLESVIGGQVHAQPKNVPGLPNSYLQKRCTIDGVEFRIAEVEAGTVNVIFTLAAPEQSR